MRRSRQNAESEVAGHLRGLRRAIQALAEHHTSEPHELSGHQTVESRQSLLLSFERLEACVDEMQEILVTIMEATRDD
ncbi:hypothetical protein EGJ27_02720 [Pseudomonas sp. v388]|uniref:hypothetical protein n=1 Tax=Pseudomonas sp. v388 TaxID=2479849 RepID=UPI000F77328A|nr:hypothetical protein [Pseudomonas sp. v388]RRV10551.1 hypothetical protein EGJ27_02720 [Pseudomonas sp. v388]